MQKDEKGPGGLFRREIKTFIRGLHFGRIAQSHTGTIRGYLKIHKKQELQQLWIASRVSLSFDYFGSHKTPTNSAPSTAGQTRLSPTSMHHRQKLTLSWTYISMSSINFEFLTLFFIKWMTLHVLLFTFISLLIFVQFSTLFCCVLCYYRVPRVVATWLKASPVKISLPNLTMDTPQGVVMVRQVDRILEGTHC
jgi:hypothetical protein